MTRISMILGEGGACSVIGYVPAAWGERALTHCDERY